MSSNRSEKLQWLADAIDYLSHDQPGREVIAHWHQYDRKIGVSDEDGREAAHAYVRLNPFTKNPSEVVFLRKSMLGRLEEERHEESDKKKYVAACMRHEGQHDIDNQHRLVVEPTSLPEDQQMAKHLEIECRADFRAALGYIERRCQSNSELAGRFHPYAEGFYAAFENDYRTYANLLIDIISEESNPRMLEQVKKEIAAISKFSLDNFEGENFSEELYHLFQKRWCDGNLNPRLDSIVQFYGTCDPSDAEDLIAKEYVRHVYPEDTEFFDFREILQESKYGKNFDATVRYTSLVESCRD